MRFTTPYRQILLIILISSFVPISAGPALLKTRYTWEGRFSKAEKAMLTTWLDDISLAVYKTFGDYPFIVHLYIHRSDNKREPVPWAHTVRHDEEGIHFYVNPGFDLREFMADWTAPHEFSHLSIPFIRKKNKWFSEGYASYMQYQVMLRAGVVTKEDLPGKYAAKLQKIMPHYDSENNFLLVSEGLKNQNNYPALYWGGACFFLQADSILRAEKDMGLIDVVRQYQHQGRSSDKGLDELISSWDEISESHIFSELLKTFRQGPAKSVISKTPIPTQQ